MQTASKQTRPDAGARMAVPLAAACLLAATVAAHAGDAPAPNSFDSFQIIGQKNVFDAGRTVRRAASQRPAPPGKTETLTLVGTMSYGRNDVAFFDSDTTELRRAVHAGDTLGGCRVEGIAPGRVRLRAGGEDFDLPIQRQLRRADEGPWQLVPEMEASPLPARRDPPAGGLISPRAVLENPRTKLPMDGPTDKQLRKLEKEIEAQFIRTEKVSKEYARELKELGGVNPAMKIPKKPKIK